MQTVAVLSAEWWFQLTVVMIYFSGFCFLLCAMELTVCIYAEIRGIPCDLPTQKDIHRLFLWFRRRKIRKQLLPKKEGVSNIFSSFNPNCHDKN